MIIFSKQNQIPQREEQACQPGVQAEEEGPARGQQDQALRAGGRTQWVELEVCRVVNWHGLFADELMNNLLQVKRIVQAKWNKSTGSDSNHSQEELTQEAEKILKKTQSKTNIFHFNSELRDSDEGSSAIFCHKYIAQGTQSPLLEMCL